MRRALAERHFDLILLDAGLPDGDGIRACQQLRAEGLETPIVLLTARGDEIDRVLGLEFGADDYLAKPVSPRELLARIRARLRRVAPVGSAPRLAAEPFRFGDFELDLGQRLLRRSGELLRLTSGEFAILAALAEHAGRPLTRDHLMNLARGEDYQSTDRSIDVMVSRLRKLIEDDSKNPRFIQTVWGVGYVLVPSGVPR
jgi:DNA-binding response OmpR family regulator